MQDNLLKLFQFKVSIIEKSNLDIMVNCKKKRPFINTPL